MSGSPSLPSPLNCTFVSYGIYDVVEWEGTNIIPVDIDDDTGLVTVSASQILLLFLKMLLILLQKMGSY